MEITILAGNTAQIPFRGIPGIARIPPDSGRNTWRTVKNSLKMTTGGLLSAGECWFLPLPLPALIAGKTPLTYQFSVKKGGKDTDR